MDLYVTINPSGTKGGGLFSDKFQEHCIGAVKRCLGTTHGGIDDLKLEKEIGGLSVITQIVQHNRRSVMRGRIGKERSKDMIGDGVRELLEENVAKYDPFKRNRMSHVKFNDRPKSIFSGLTPTIIDRFVANKRREYRLKYT